MKSVSALLLFLSCQCQAGPVDSSDSPTETGSSVPACEDAEAILTEGGMNTGFVRCSSGAVNRKQAIPVSAEDYVVEIPPCGQQVEGSCTVDEDCADAPSGYCYQGGGTYGFPPFCDCTYLCTSDEDCGGDQACVAPEAHDLPLAWPICVQADCKQDADCTSGQCGVASVRDCGFGQLSLVCRTSMDECDDASDCNDGNWNCFSYEEHLVCTPDACD